MKKIVLRTIAVVLLAGWLVSIDSCFTAITGNTLLWKWMAPNYPFLDLPLSQVDDTSRFMSCGFMGFLFSIVGTIGLTLLFKSKNT